MTILGWELLERKYQHKYETEYVDYKDQARKMIVEKLGFEVNVDASVTAELMLRRMLDRLAKGDAKQENIDRCLDTCLYMTRCKVFKRVPEQAHLIKTKDIECMLWNETDKKPKFKVISTPQKEDEKS